jgi:hypothetical protein
MEQDFKDIQRRIDGPPTAQVRNINVDTHIGQAPQRPYALLEDAMATVTLGWPNAAAMRASLRGAPEASSLPDGAPNPNAVEGEDGGLFRYVISQDVRTPLVVNNEIHETLRFEKRNVSLSQQGARTASENGSPTDYWNGFTWLREGYKAERDFPVMAQAAAANDEQPMVFTAPVSPSDAASLRHNVARMDINRPPLPVSDQPARQQRPAAKDKE